MIVLASQHCTRENIDRLQAWFQRCQGMRGIFGLSDVPAEILKAFPELWLMGKGLFRFATQEFIAEQTMDNHWKLHLPIIRVSQEIRLGPNVDILTLQGTRLQTTPTLYYGFLAHETNVGEALWHNPESNTWHPTETTGKAGIALAGGHAGTTVAILLIKAHPEHTVHFVQASYPTFGV